MALLFVGSLPFAALGIARPRAWVVLVPLVAWLVLAALGELGILPRIVTGTATLLLGVGVGVLEAGAGVALGRARRPSRP